MRLSFFLEALTSSGRLFHRRGPQHWNEASPWVFVQVLSEHKRPLGWTGKNMEYKVRKALRGRFPEPNLKIIKLLFVEETMLSILWWFDLNRCCNHFNRHLFILFYKNCLTLWNPLQSCIGHQLCNTNLKGSYCKKQKNMKPIQWSFKTCFLFGFTAIFYSTLFHRSPFGRK